MIIKKTPDGTITQYDSDGTTIYLNNPGAGETIIGIGGGGASAFFPDSKSDIVLEKKPYGYSGIAYYTNLQLIRNS